MKVWQMSDYDWVVAETLEEAKDCLAEVLGCEKPEDLEEYLDDPRPLTDEELDKHEFEHDPDDGGDEPEDGWPKSTFRTELARRLDKGEKAPFYFAGAE